MDALIAREMALGAAGNSSAASRKASKPAANGKKKRPPARDEPAAAVGSGTGKTSLKKQKVTMSAYSTFNADWDSDDSIDDEDDEDLAENGYAVPDALTNPATDADAQAFVGRRVYIDGVPGRDALAGELIGWRKNKGAWEVELDRRDERVFIASKNLRWLDQPPPPRKKPMKKKKAAGGSSSGASASGASDGGKKLKPKKKKARE